MTYSIIKKSQLEGALRLDAEYYQPEYLDLEKKLDNFGERLRIFDKILIKGTSLTGGATPLGAEYPSEGVKFLRVQNIMQGYLDFSDIVYIDKKIHDGHLKRSKLIEGDVLLTITGVSYGKSAIYKSEFGECNINQHSVRLHFNEDFLPEYISMFLNSKYGKFQSDRKITGNTRPALAYEEIRDYKIPLVDKKLQQDVKNIYDESISVDKKAKRFYAEAEELLLEELGLKNYIEEESLFSIVNLSDIKKANRIDAEYFQEKYQKLFSKNKSQKLGDLVSMSKGFEPGSEAYQENGKLFIRVSSLSKDGIVESDQKYLNNDLYQKLRKNFEPKVGEILLTKDATPGIAYVVKEPIEAIICGGILKLKAKENIEPEYLAFCINSIIGKCQVKRDSGGSVIAHWKPEQVKNLQIPILPKSTQKKITELVKKSHESRKRAKELLDEAKQKVENLIENKN